MEPVILVYDERRNITIPGPLEATVDFAASHFISKGQKAIADHGYFAVALSGGSTPKRIFGKLLEPAFKKELDWSRVWLFWSDERCVPLDHPESNYHMAMQFFSKLPVPSKHIFPMRTDENVEESARAYEGRIRKMLPDAAFDLIMLGVGEDGHTASLFPRTHGLHPLPEELVIANFIPEKACWRLTLTFHCIHLAHNLAVYALGKEKAQIVKTIFTAPYDPDLLPAQALGIDNHKALWILDEAAASMLIF